MTKAAATAHQRTAAPLPTALRLPLRAGVKRRLPPLWDGVKRRRLRLLGRTARLLQLSSSNSKAGRCREASAQAEASPAGHRLRLWLRLWDRLRTRGPRSSR
jgi:hypothetical protein